MQLRVLLTYRESLQGLLQDVDIDGVYGMLGKEGSVTKHPCCRNAVIIPIVIRVLNEVCSDFIGCISWGSGPFPSPSICVNNQLKC